MKIVVLQTDNRKDLAYINLSKYINKTTADSLGYTYSFEFMHKKYHERISPCSAKIFVVHNYIHNNPIDLLIFLDTDAWIQDPFKLSLLVTQLLKSDKHGCMSRDPYDRVNTYINSGSFILKINEYTKKMYKDIIQHMESDLLFVNRWPFDQYYFSHFVQKNKDKFYIFRPEVLNTPDGIILRHNWYKNEKMTIDMTNRINDLNNDPFDLIDKMAYPNFNLTEVENKKELEDQSVVVVKKT